jgi:hypothetical protein
VDPLEHKAHELVGEASMCWLPRPDDAENPSKRVFDTTRAGDVARRIVELVRDAGALVDQSIAPERRSAFKRVRLEMSTGHYVESVSIPWFITPPAVVIWGCRVFTLCMLAGVPEGHDDVYREAFAYMVPMTPGVQGGGDGNPEPKRTRGE